MKDREGKWFSLVLGGAILLWILLGPIQTGAEERLVLTLDQAIQKALEFSPEIRETQYDVEVFQGKKQQADGARWLRLSFWGWEARPIGPEETRSTRLIRQQTCTLTVYSEGPTSA